MTTSSTSTTANTQQGRGRRRWIRMLLVVPLLLAAPVPASAVEPPDHFFVVFDQARLNLNVTDPGRSTLVAFVEPGAAIGPGRNPGQAWVRAHTEWRIAVVKPYLFHATSSPFNTGFLQVNTGRKEVYWRRDGQFGAITQGGQTLLLPHIEVEGTTEMNGQVTAILLHVKRLRLLYDPRNERCEVLADEFGVSSPAHWDVRQVAPYLYHFRQRRPAVWGGGIPDPTWIWDDEFVAVNTERQQVWWVREGRTFGDSRATGTMLPCTMEVYAQAGGPPTGPPPTQPPPVQPPVQPPTTGAPRLLSPAAGAVLDNGRTDSLDPIQWDFSWSPIPGANAYHIEVGRAGAEPTVRDRVAGTTFRHTVPGGFIGPAALQGWTWRVRALVNDVPGPWSESRPFQLEPPNTDGIAGAPSSPGGGGTASADVPRLLAPAPNATLDNGRRDGRDDMVWEFSWTAVPGADAYELIVERGGSTMPLFRQIVRGAPSYRHVVSGTFIADANRYGWMWKVRAHRGGRPLGWSDLQGFIVEPEDTDPPR